MKPKSQNNILFFEPPKGRRTKLKARILITLVFGIALAASLITALTRPPLFTPQLKVRPTIADLKNGDYKVINEGHPGEKLDIRSYLIPNKYTVFDFESEYCPSCINMRPELVDMTKLRPDIGVRSVDVNRPGTEGIDWSSPLCKQYRINFTPNFKIYGPDGRLLREGKAASNELRAFIASLFHD